MFRSFRIGSLLGIPIKLGVTFLSVLLITALNVGAVRSPYGSADRSAEERPDDAAQRIEKPRW